MNHLIKLENKLTKLVDTVGYENIFEVFLDLKYEIQTKEKGWKNMIKMPLSEICDRYSICKLKDERTSEDMSEELNLYEKEIKKYNGNFWDFWEYVDKLYQVNGSIWDLESSLRQGKEEEIGYEEVGKRAIKIRDLNKERISIKNEIVTISGEGFKDIKINHASQ